MRLMQIGTNFAHFSLDRLTVIALRDGHVDMPSSQLRRIDGQAFAELPASVRLIDGRLRLSVNTFLIIEPKRRILIDTGAADSWEPSMGLLPKALAEAGIDPASIDTVALTHTHADHINGLVGADGADAFPGLTQLHVPQAEADIFERRPRLARFLSRFDSFSAGQRLSDSITTLALAGHSPGHSGFSVKTANAELVIWGDIIHVPSIQFAAPDISWVLDSDQKQARAARLKILAQIADTGRFIAGAHLDFPGIGQVHRASEGEPVYAFSPIR